MGGLAVGLISFAGCAFGILAAIGGVAIGSFAWGGLGIGFVAMGGMAIGVWAAGGSAIGAFKADATHVDPQAEVVFAPFAHWYIWLAWMGGLTPIFFGAVYLFSWFMLRRQAKAQFAESQINSAAKSSAAGSR
jgi:hypothetical protein